MSVEDFRINAFVRQVLSRFWIDAQSLRYGAVGRVVYLHGRFEKLRVPDPHDPDHAQHAGWVQEDRALLETVEKEIRRESTVQDVVFRLENFRKRDGKWVASGV